jgi:hypothetical protein
MKLRRRISLPTAQELRPLVATITAGIWGAWNGIFNGTCEGFFAAYVSKGHQRKSAEINAATTP